MSLKRDAVEILGGIVLFLMMVFSDLWYGLCDKIEVWLAGKR